MGNTVPTDIPFFTTAKDGGFEMKYGKTIQKIIAFGMAMLFVLGSFSACGKQNKNAVSAGVFYQYFAEREGIDLTSHVGDDGILSPEEAESLLFEYDYLDESQLKKWNAPITKDLVAQICVRSSNFRETGSMQIKDIKRCCDQQAAIDSVQMGLLSLQNDYFDAKQQFTAQDCIDVMDRLEDHEMNSHYEVGEYEIVYKEDVLDMTGIEVSNVTISSSSVSESMAQFDSPKVGYLSNAVGAKTTQIDETVVEGDKYTFEIDKFDAMNAGLGFDLVRAKGQIMVLDNLKGDYKRFDQATNTQNNRDLVTPTAIRVESAVLTGGSKLKVSGTFVKPEEYVDVDGTVNKNPLGKSFVPSRPIQLVDCKLPDDLLPVNIKVENGTLKVTYSHTFNLEGGADKLQKASPKITTTASVGNFKVDSKDLFWMTIGVAKNSYLKLTYDTSFETKIEAGGLRYSPDNNRNGGLKFKDGKITGNALANFKRARFTGAGAGGSEAIKIAQANIPLGSTGFSIKVNLFIVVELDGSLRFEVEYQNGFEFEVKNKNISFHSLKQEKKKELEVRANIDVSLNVCPEIDLFGANLIDATLKLGFNIEAMASLYHEESGTFTDEFCATEDDLKDLSISNSGFKYCIGVSCMLYVQAIAFDTPNKARSLAKVICDLLGKSNPKTEKKSLWDTSFHYEDGHFVDECTRGKDKKAETNDSGEIALESYNEVVQPNETVLVSIDSFPTQKGLFRKNTVEYVFVKSKDESVATATYDRTNRRICITGKGVGSTEIYIRVPKYGQISGIYGTLFPNADLEKYVDIDSKISYTNAVAITVTQNGNVSGVSTNNVVSSINQYVC